MGNTALIMDAEEDYGTRCVCVYWFVCVCGLWCVHIVHVCVCANRNGVAYAYKF